MGEQHVFWMTVVFSHEYVAGWERHDAICGRVLGSVNLKPERLARDGAARSATMLARAGTDISTAG